MQLLAGFITLCLGSQAFAARSVPISIKEGHKAFRGDLYLPAKAQNAPLVVVIHEWWGKTEHPLERARKIADDLGYAALAVDLYGEGKTVKTPPEAQALASPFYQDPSIGVKRLHAFIDAVKTQPIDLSRIAVIGFCFGGSQALNLARANKWPDSQKLVGVVSFHGGLTSAIKAQSPLKTKLLVLNGGDDPMVKPEDIAAFKKEMEQAQADLKFISYPNALHAFTNPKATAIGEKYHMPIAYNAEADRKSWDEMKSFLSQVFSQ